ncbi:MAG: fluoride efflux transporter CrcB [Hyphomicrobiaceae bacterium]|nr:fluoride efflux transporter CrcB [Hyphomicrobiaceae bacterium]
MKFFLLASAGGALGAGARYLVNVGMGRLLGTSFPWGTLTVNIVGSLLMGILIEALSLKFGGSLEARTFLATGVLGGFTTFSAFSLDVAVLASRGETGLAFLYVAVSVLAAIAMLYAGMAMTRWVLT